MAARCKKIADSDRFQGFILGEEPAEAGVVDFAEERSHRAVIARRAVTKRIRRGPRPGEEKSPGPLPLIFLLGLDPTLVSPGAK